MSQTRRTVIVAFFFALSITVFAQTNPCDADAPGPFVIQSAKGFTVQWCTATTRSNPSNPAETIPERIDGHYLQIDTGTKQLITATDLGVSTVTKRRAWQYMVASGVARGNHTVSVNSWNWVLDAAGNATSVRSEGPVATVPFAAADPFWNVPPLAPTGGRVLTTK